MRIFEFWIKEDCFVFVDFGQSFFDIIFGFVVEWKVYWVSFGKQNFIGIYYLFRCVVFFDFDKIFFFYIYMNKFFC